MSEPVNTKHSWPTPELMEKIRLQGISPSGPFGGPPAVVSLEEFFLHNDDYGSFAPNVTLPPPPAPPGLLGKLRSLIRPPLGGVPGPSAFYELFKQIRDRNEVQDVLVAVREVEEESDGRLYPWSDTVYILARASHEEVATWLEGPLHPDDLSEGWMEEPSPPSDLSEGDAPRKPPAAPELANGVRVFAAWWD